MKGIFLIACGHAYYGKMAAALAATLKASDKTLPIHLAYAGDALNHLSAGEKDLFDSYSIIPPEYYTTAQGVKWIRTKMFIYELSPFDETLYLDCDILWLKRSPAELFDQLKNYDITFSNFGSGGSMWANHQEIKKAYNITQPIYGIHSELIYFKKSEKVKNFFDTALSIFDDIKIKHIVFAGSIPDELPLSIAAAITNTKPHRSNYRPVFWAKMEPGHKHIYLIAQKFYAVSMAGNTNTNFEIDTYNTLSSAAYHKLGLQKPFSWKMKRSFLPERKNL
jgi:hypothetical protein